VHVYVEVCMGVCVYVGILSSVRMYEYMHVCMYAYAYLHSHTHTHTHTYAYFVYAHINSGSHVCTLKCIHT
jgi:hypothetical protein